MKQDTQISAVISNRQLEIIEAAGKLLTTSGVSGLTIKNLAKEMGFSESALYRHFPGKEEIIVAMLIYLADNIDQRLQSAVSRQDSPGAKLQRMFESHIEFFKEHPHFVVAVFSDGLMEESQSINGAIMRIMNANIKHLMPIILEGQQKGVFTNAIPTEELLHIVMGALRLQMYKWRVANFQFDLKRSGNNIIQAILTLIKKR